MLEDKPRTARKEINLIPLINIIFLLLVFFVIAGTMEKTDSLPVSLPLSAGNGDAKPQGVDIIYIQKDGTVAVNDDLVGKSDFQTIINTLLLDGKGRKLIVKSDSQTESSHLIWVMQAIENAGGSDISIVTRVSK